VKNAVCVDYLDIIALNEIIKLLFYFTSSEIFPSRSQQGSTYISI
jgi:hypothetical protein